MAKIIKVRVLDGSIKEFDVENMYLKKIKTVEIDFYSELCHQYYIGEFINSTEKVYGVVNDFAIDDVTAINIKKDFPKIEIIEEVDFQSV